MNDLPNPFAAPVHGLDRHGDPAVPPREDLVYVGFWLRVVATIVDSVLQMIACLPLVFIWPRLTDDAEVITPRDILEVIIPLVTVLAFWWYWQATPGKMLFKARIVDARTYGRPSFGQLLLRYLGYIPATLVFFAGIVWVAFDQRKRGWHDMMAGTVVVRPRPQD